MSNLYAFGCSLTYGHGLPDCWIKKFRMPGDYPSKYAWPQLLADKLQRKCINLSAPGESNKGILFTLQQNLKHISSEDTVYIKWSYDNRWGVINEDNNKIKHVKAGTKEYKIWLKMFYSQEDARWYTENCIDYATLLLNDKKIKHFHLTAVPDYLETLNCKYAKFLENGSIKPIRDVLPTALDGTHPGKEAHAEFANVVYKETLAITGEHNET